MLVDTAGRLHTRANLMHELEKIRRVAAREVPGAPHDVLLVLDATVGQNGLAQAREFMGTAGVNGIVLAKLDGTAKGGIAVAIAHDLKLPIRYVGVGEAHRRPPAVFRQRLRGRALRARSGRAAIDTSDRGRATIRVCPTWGYGQDQGGRRGWRRPRGCQFAPHSERRMFDALSTRLQDVFRSLRGEARLTDAHVDAALREIRLALLEADVNFKVVKAFVDRVRAARSVRMCFEA